MVSTAAGLETEPTSDRLLAAAERLIADRGLDGVSLRAVNAEAGTNVAAVHYHFGSRDALVAAVLDRRMSTVATRRLQLLAPLEAVDRPAIRDVIAVLVRPLAELAADPDGDGRRYVRFLAALAAAGARWRTVMADAFAAQYERIRPVLARALPDVPGVLREFRLSLATGPMLSTLADPDHAAVAAADGARLSYDDLVEALIDAVAGMLAAPVTPSTGGPA